jgi:superfamily II DNA or RNA helicase
MLFGIPFIQTNPYSFARQIERLLWHSGFTAISNVDGANDGGADIVAKRGEESWVIQSKWKSSGRVDEDAIEQLVAGMTKYRARFGAVATTTDFTKRARDRVRALSSNAGLEIRLWTGQDLTDLCLNENTPTRFGDPQLRPYQIDAFQSVQHDLRVNGRSLLVLATGLGKTVIAGNVVDSFVSQDQGRRVLVLAHQRELVDQLERSLWRHLPKHVPTQQIKGTEKPDLLEGVTVATIQSAITYVRDGFTPDLIVVDEAHHAGGDGQYADLFDHLPETSRLGVTATPWRGDEFDITYHFGPPSFKLGIEEGMRLGYLADVKYELYLDDIDWDFVRASGGNSYSIKELNSKLFLPQRDEKIRDQLLTVWAKVPAARAIVFCQTIEHAKRMAELLGRVPYLSAVEEIHNEVPSAERKARLAKFRLGQTPILVAVDMLNEGVDIPDVNIVCFARVTHSRRIFVQQLGRGLRLSPGKQFVHVLDFVSDLRRIAAALNIKRAVVNEIEELHLDADHSIHFSNQESESFFSEWIADAANLETAADEYRLNFPSSG